MGWKMSLAAAFVMALALCGPSQAAWHKVETDRFIVYGEGREATIRERGR